MIVGPDCAPSLFPHTFHTCLPWGWAGEQHRKLAVPGEEINLLSGQSSCSSRSVGWAGAEPWICSLGFCYLDLKYFLLFHLRVCLTNELVSDSEMVVPLLYERNLAVSSTNEAAPLCWSCQDLQPSPGDRWTPLPPPLGTRLCDFRHGFVVVWKEGVSCWVLVCQQYWQTHAGIGEDWATNRSWNSYRFRVPVGFRYQVTSQNNTGQYFKWRNSGFGAAASLECEILCEIVGIPPAFLICMADEQ